VPRPRRDRRRAGLTPAGRADTRPGWVDTRPARRAGGRPAGRVGQHCQVTGTCWPWLSRVEPAMTPVSEIDDPALCLASRPGGEPGAAVVPFRSTVTSSVVQPRALTWTSGPLTSLNTSNLPVRRFQRAATGLLSLSQKPPTAQSPARS